MENTNRVNRRDVLKVAGCAMVFSPMTSSGAVISRDLGPIYTNNSLLGKGAETAVVRKDVFENPKQLGPLVHDRHGSESSAPGAT